MSGREVQEGDEGAAPAHEVYANGLLQFLRPAVQDVEERLQATFDSQADLARQVDRVLMELNKVIGHQPPPSLSPYVHKLGNARKRITSVNSTLVSIRTRLERIHHQITGGRFPLESSSPRATPEKDHDQEEGGGEGGGEEEKGEDEEEEKREDEDEEKGEDEEEEKREDEDEEKGEDEEEEKGEDEEEERREDVEEQKGEDVEEQKGEDVEEEKGEDEEEEQEQKEEDEHQRQHQQHQQHDESSSV